MEQQTQTFNDARPPGGNSPSGSRGPGEPGRDEATGVYWKTVFEALEPRFECWLLNAHHLHNVPGRKTDVADSEWICQLVEHGLVRPSFVPPREIRGLRDLTRLRKAQTDERTRAIQRLEKVLQGAGIKLTGGLDDVLEVRPRDARGAGRGRHRPDRSPSSPEGKMRAKIPQLTEALPSRFSRAPRARGRPLLAHIDTLDNALQDLSERIEPTSPHRTRSSNSSARSRASRQTRRGPDRRVRREHESFPIVGHFASWAGVCPGNHNQPVAASGRTRPGPLADRAADRCAKGRSAPRTPTWPPTTPSSEADAAGESGGGDPPRHPGRLFPRRPRQRPVPGARTRLASTRYSVEHRARLLHANSRPSATRSPSTKSNQPPQSKPSNPPNKRRPGLPPTVPPARTSTAQTWSLNSGIHRTASFRRSSLDQPQFGPPRPLPVARKGSLGQRRSPARLHGKEQPPRRARRLFRSGESTRHRAINERAARRPAGERPRAVETARCRTSVQWSGDESASDYPTS